MDEDEGDGLVLPSIVQNKGREGAARRAAQKFYRARQARGAFFDVTFFGEPGWDILLDLFASEGIGRPASITSACVAAGVPPSTALRWISVLVERGMIERTADIADARRIFLTLTEKSRGALIDYFANMAGRGLV
jgi:DNA-binding MarR family transcriptional regulator